MKTILVAFIVLNFSFFIKAEAQTKTDSLIQFVVKHPPNSMKDIALIEDAILELGELKESKAIDILVQKLDFILPGKTKPLQKYSFLDYCPAAKALINIGSPAIPAIIEDMASFDHEGRYLRLSATVIYVIQGITKNYSEYTLDYILKASEKYKGTKKERLVRFVAEEKALYSN